MSNTQGAVKPKEEQFQPLTAILNLRDNPRSSDAERALGNEMRLWWEGMATPTQKHIVMALFNHDMCEKRESSKTNRAVLSNLSPSLMAAAFIAFYQNNKANLQALATTPGKFDDSEQTQPSIHALIAVLDMGVRSGEKIYKEKEHEVFDNAVSYFEDKRSVAAISDPRLRAIAGVVEAVKAHTSYGKISATSTARLNALFERFDKLKPGMDLHLEPTKYDLK